MTSELTAWMQMLALDYAASRWETQAPADVPILRRRASRPRRPPPAAAACHDLALGHPPHRRDHPPPLLRARLTSPNRPYDQEGQTRGPA